MCYFLEPCLVFGQKGRKNAHKKIGSTIIIVGPISWLVRNDVFECFSISIELNQLDFFNSFCKKNFKSHQISLWKFVGQGILNIQDLRCRQTDRFWKSDRFSILSKRSDSENPTTSLFCPNGRISENPTASLFCPNGRILKIRTLHI